MLQFIQKIIFGIRFKRAVREADWQHHITHRKHMVLVVGGKLMVFSKRDIKRLVASGTFRKGTTVQDIERRALYITL